MMAEKEYIERGKLLRKAMYICKTYGIPKITTERLKKAMADSTAADVTEVRHGEWKTPYDGFHDMIEIVCSVCGHTGMKHFKYCPACGAKMDGERKEQK